MNARTRQSPALRRLSWLLLLALAPMLTFMGHWPASLPIPGTDSQLAVPLAGKTAPDDHAGSHGQHCHGDSAGCSDVPAQAGLGFALLSEPLLAIGSGGLLVALALLWWRPRSSPAIGPELRPPRTHVLFAC